MLARRTSPQGVLFLISHPLLLLMSIYGEGLRGQDAERSMRTNHGRVGQQQAYWRHRACLRQRVCFEDPIFGCYQKGQWGSVGEVNRWSQRQHCRGGREQEQADSYRAP